MLLFVAAAAFALLLAPTRGGPVSAAKPLAVGPSAPATPASDLAEPWRRSDKQPDASSVLSRQAAELAADEVVDPWAVRPPPPPLPVTVVDVPVDPWASQGDFTSVANAASPKSTREVGEGVRDPWRTARARERRSAAPPRAPHAAPAQPSGEGIADPWKGRSTRAKAAPATPHRPRALPPPQTSSRSRDGVVDPWH